MGPKIDQGLWGEQDRSLTYGEITPAGLDALLSESRAIIPEEFRSRQTSTNSPSFL